jgi:hypothetical protein
MDSDRCHAESLESMMNLLKTGQTTVIEALSKMSTNDVNLINEHRLLLTTLE